MYLLQGPFHVSEFLILNRCFHVLLKYLHDINPKLTLQARFENNSFWFSKVEQQIQNIASQTLDINFQAFGSKILCTGPTLNLSKLCIIHMKF